MLLVAMDNMLYECPIKDPQTILDIGTGTGIWAMYAYSSTHVSCMLTHL